MTSFNPKHRAEKPRLFSSLSARKSRLVVSILLTSFLLTVGGLALAVQITLTGVEKGAGVIDTDVCLQGARISFTYSIAQGGSTSVTGLTVSGLTSGCSGKYISLQILNSSANLVDEIIWHPTLAAGDTTITLRTDGTTTSTSNSSANSATISWPDSQTSPEGSQTFASSSASELRLSILAAPRAANG